MVNLQDIEKRINERLARELSGNKADVETFSQLTDYLLEIGVKHYYYDAIKEDMSFYTEEQYICSAPRSDLLQARKTSSWIGGDKLDKQRLEQAIKAVDLGELSVVDFHREIFAAGVISATIFLVPGKIYYLGCDGEVYLERYSK